MDLIAEDGIRSLSFQRIANQCSLKKGSVHYFFDSVENICVFILKYITVSAQAVAVQYLKKAKPIDSRIESHFNAVFSWAQQFPKQVIALNSIYAIACDHEEMQKNLRSIRKIGFERLSIILQEDFHLPKKQAQELASSIQIMVFGFIIDWAATQRFSLTTCKRLSHTIMMSMLQDLH